MASNSERAAFQELYSTLNDGLQSGICEVADQAFSRDLISEGYPEASNK